MSDQWRNEIAAFTRAFAGAIVFGIPLVFTMEMWWIGKSLSFTNIVIIVLLALLANLGLARVAGFRNDHSWLISFDQAVDALAVGVVSGLVFLAAINQARLSDGLESITTTVLLLALPLSLGASVAQQVFSGRTGAEKEELSDLSVWQGVLADVGATAIGGVFIGLSIAPTDEGAMIAAGLTWWHESAIILLSLFVSYLIVFASGFDEPSPPGVFQHPLTETVLTYLVSLLVAFAMLVVLERISFSDPFHEIVRMTVVLALPVSIGGAGGRLVI